MVNLKEQLRALCGDDGYSVNLDSASYTLYVEIGLEAQSKYDDVELLLKRVVPANLVIVTTLKYNQNKDFTSMTHRALSGYSHSDIRSSAAF
jgi:hypothetical protein